MVSMGLLEELKEIVKEEYKTNFTDQQISELGNGLSSYFEQLSRLACERHYENENSRDSTS